MERADLDFTLGEWAEPGSCTPWANAFEKMRHSLRTSLESQWRAEQGRREMLAALAHDLFTPLTIILGHAENLLNRESQARRAPVSPRSGPSMQIANGRSGSWRKCRRPTDWNGPIFPFPPPPWTSAPTWRKRRKNTFPYATARESVCISVWRISRRRPRTDAAGRTAPVANSRQCGHQRPSLHPRPGAKSAGACSWMRRVWTWRSPTRVRAFPKRTCATSSSPFTGETRRENRPACRSGDVYRQGPCGETRRMDHRGQRTRGRSANPLSHRRAVGEMERKKTDARPRASAANPFHPYKSNMLTG